MTTASINQIDVLLRDAVVHQLDWDPEVDASAIGVAAKDGVITLTGFIDTSTGTLTAERVVKQVRGVRVVANDITVRLLAGRTDPDIAHDAAQALRLRPLLAENVQAVVDSGRVTLTGTVEWVLQRDRAADAVAQIPGVLGVINHITVNPKARLRSVQRRIVRALHRNADLDARHMSVIVSDDVVTLKGTVGSWLQRNAAERAAGRAPGIRRVDNEIVVEPREPHEVEPPDEMCCTPPVGTTTALERPMSDS
jgi:osmotically-inducible protein OsmY